MAVAVTGAMYKSLSFDNTSSRSYGVYITGEAVYNAPERAVEMISIPGRNGAFALDKGRFENIEVSYPAGIFADNEADFAQAVSDFRNFLCSKKGYCRLSDEYNPSEYRMAVYKSGLEVDPAQLRAGEFTITFDCKPQRWLTSGEVAVDIGTWGDTETETGDIVTIDNSSDVLAIKTLSADINAVQSGSGTPSPDNIRPITGFTEVKVSRTGKNLLPNLTYVSGNNTFIGVGADSFTIFLKASQNYTLSRNTDVACGLYMQGNGDGSNTMLLSSATASGTATKTFTVPKDNYYKFWVYKSGGVSVSDINWFQLELGSSATTYEPYNGTTYTISLSSAGTVYGGTLDVDSGVLTVDTVTATCNGSETWNTNSKNGLTVYNKLPVATSAFQGKCNLLPTLSSDQAETGVLIGQNNRHLYVNNILNVVEGVTDADSWKTYLSSHNLVITCPTTPQTYNLTAQDISLLLGTNNIWADSGDVEVEYGQNPNILVNPTLFESSPLLEVEGYGTIGFNDYEIELDNAVIGEVVLADGKTKLGNNNTIWFSSDQLNTGDDISVGSITFNAELFIYTGNVSSLTNSNNEFTTTGQMVGANYIITTTISLTRTKGSSGTVKSTTITVSGTDYMGVAFTSTNQITVILTDGMLEYRQVQTKVSGNMYYNTQATQYEDVVGDSTLSILGHPTYIDCDLGEAYLINNNTPVSLNAYIDLGSDLPKLASGSNTVTYDNTITDLKITPRWWRV